MNSNQSTSSLQPEEDIDEFLHYGARNFNQEPVIKWGPKDDLDNFLQQTINCLDACKMAIECTFSGMSQQTMQDKWDKIANSHGNNRSLDPNFVHTQDCKIKAKSMESKQLTSQQFWMFHRVDRKEIYVVFSSQETSAYILSDANVWKIPRQEDITSVDNIPICLFKAILSQGYQLVLTGHSLGGAIAILATCKLLMKDLDDTQINKIRCIAFGAPQVSFQNLGQIFKLNKIIFRYELPKDPVPQLLTAFQRAKNPSQEFLVNLLHLLGIQNSFRHTQDMYYGLRDFIQLSESGVNEIKEIGELGTVFVPQSLIVASSPFSKIQYYINCYQEWHFLKDLNLDGCQKQTKYFLNKFIDELRKEHQFERYEQELLQIRLNGLKLPKVGDELEAVDMLQFRFPESNKCSCKPKDLKNCSNQISATFDEKLTKVVIMSKHPYVLGIRSGEIQQYPGWGIVASQILQDQGDYKIMFVFYSADNYQDLKKNSLMKIKLCGCFETIANIEVEAKQVSVEDALEIRSSTFEIRNCAYENINLQQLYNSAFQACLFAGEGHNPMLQVQNQSENQRYTLLQEDHNSLVELLGSLIVNQECLEIILKENQGQFQTMLAKQQRFNTCDKKFQNDVEFKENQEKLVELAQKNLSEIYNRFKFNPKGQFLAWGQTSNKNWDVKDCVKESIPTLFSLGCSLTWQMKMILWGQTAIFRTGGAGLAVGGIAGAAVEAEAAAAGGALAAAGVIGAAVGAVALITFGLGASIYSFSQTGVAFKRFFKNSEEMQRSYKQQLEQLLKLMGYELKEEHSIAGLEKKLAELCQELLKQDEIGYDYDNSEKYLNQKLLEYTLKTNVSQEKATKEETELKELINKKIKLLSSKNIFKKHKNNIKLAPSRALSALALFIWNNYRIRLCLSKTWRIGIMGGKNAGKSTLSKLLGGAIDGTGENRSTEDATLYQNTPTERFCVIDFPHLNNIVANNDNMKEFYALSDITIIVMNGYNRAKEEQQNREIGEIIKTIQKKYSQLGYENADRRLPVLLLFNQVDKMIFNEYSINDPDDETLSQNFKSLKKQIIDRYKWQYGIDEKKVYFLFASIKPQLPKASVDRVRQLTLELQNQFITQKISAEEFAEKTLELVQRGNSVDRSRLQNITGCSFFSWEQDPQENPQSIISILAKMVEDLGDKEGADSIIDHFRTNNQQIQTNS